MRVAVVLAVAVIAATSGCSDYPADSAEEAVRSHIEAADRGDVTALRELACGDLAQAMASRTDEQVRAAFADYYDPAPDWFSDEQRGDRVWVSGYYSGISHLEIAFVTERHGDWQVCEVRRGNGPYGALPGPFG
ncbi:hypothetical protein ACWDOP_27450 [Nocardia sp. NPDC003693]